jgi:hypothetical protein
MSGRGDLPAPLRLLALDVTLWADGGGKAPAAAMQPIHGRDNVAQLLTSQAGRLPQGTLDPRYRQVNGDPAVLLFRGEAPFAVIVLDLTPDGEQVRGIYAIANPDKLARVH